MYCARCPICGAIFRGSDRRALQEEVRRHLLEAHGEEIRLEARRLEARGGKGPTPQWLAGVKASYSIWECAGP